MGRTKDSGLDGVLVIDKGPGWTSHDVVAKLRGVLKQRRAGHAGTLDPDATGVLIVGFGQATKLLPFLQALPKTYTGEVVLGTETSTLDASGLVTATHPMAPVSVADAQTVAQRFVGEILQIPPMVSAVHVGGRRLHELAREGIEVERAPRPATVYRFDVVSQPEPNVLGIEVVCGSGTYVRTLAADLGTALGGGAHLRNLRRTDIGSFRADDAVAVDDVRADTPLLSLRDAMRDMAPVVISESHEAGVRNGVVLSLDGPDEDPNWRRSNGPWAVIDKNGALLAMYVAHGADRAKPAAVMAR